MLQSTKPLLYISSLTSCAHRRRLACDYQGKTLSYWRENLSWTVNGSVLRIFFPEWILGTHGSFSRWTTKQSPLRRFRERSLYGFGREGQWHFSTGLVGLLWTIVVNETLPPCISVFGSLSYRWILWNNAGGCYGTKSEKHVGGGGADLSVFPQLRYRPTLLSTSGSESI